MDFPKNIDPGMRLFLAMLAIASRTKNRAEAVSIERVAPPPQATKTLRAEAEAIIKVPASPPPTENALNVAQLGINEIQRILKCAPHLKDGEKASFSITTSRTGSNGTKTHTYSAQFAPNSMSVTAQRKLT